MKVVVIAYSYVGEYSDPGQWLERIEGYTGIVEALSNFCSVTSFHNINFRGVIAKNGVEYIFERYAGLSRFFPLKIHREIRRIRPDSVIVQGFNSPVQILQLRYYLPKHCKIYVQHRADKPGSFLKRVAQKVADRYVSKYLFASIGAAEKWISNGVIKNKNKVLAIMGASSSLKQENKIDARNSLQMKGAPIFLWVGRLNENKDPKTLVKGFLRYAAQNPEAVLYLIYQTDELLEEVRAILASHPLASSVKLIGKVEHEELYEWYSSADFIVCSSFFESGNVSVLEGMSCGCIPIVTNIPSFEFHTNNRKLGMSFNAGDAEGLFQQFNSTKNIDIVHTSIEVKRYFDENLSFVAIAQRLNNIIAGKAS